MERKSLSAKKDQNAFKKSPTKQSRDETAIKAKAISTLNKKLFKVVLDDKVKQKFKEKKSGIPKFTKVEYEAFVCEVEGKQAQAKQSSQKIEGGQFQYPPNQARTNENEENICTEGRKHNLFNGDENSASKDIHAYDSGNVSKASESIISNCGNQRISKTASKLIFNLSKNKLNFHRRQTYRSESLKEHPATCPRSADRKCFEYQVKTRDIDHEQRYRKYAADTSQIVTKNLRIFSDSTSGYQSVTANEQQTNQQYCAVSGDAKPRSDDVSKPRSCGFSKLRTDGDSKPQSDGVSKPRSGGDAKLRTGGVSKPRSDVSKPRSGGISKMRTDGFESSYTSNQDESDLEEKKLSFDPKNKMGSVPKLFEGYGAGNIKFWEEEKGVTVLTMGSDGEERTEDVLSAGKKEKKGKEAVESQKEEGECGGPYLKEGNMENVFDFPNNSGSTPSEGNIKVDSWASLLETDVPKSIQVSFQAPNCNQRRGQVIPPVEITKAGCGDFVFTLVGYTLDTNLPYSLVRNTTMRYWTKAGLKDMLATESGFYFFQFNCLEQCKAVLEGGPWHIVGHPLVLKQWHSGLKMKKEAIKVLPMWVKIYDVPLEYWNSEGLSCIGSSIGKPLQVDRITSMRSRISYARMCIDIDAEEPLLEELELIVQNPISNQQESIFMKLEYQWRPKRCGKCKVFGHECEAQQQQEYEVSLIPRRYEECKIVGHECADKVQHPQKKDRVAMETKKQTQPSRNTGEWQVKENRKNAKTSSIYSTQIANSYGTAKILPTSPMVTNTRNKFAALQDCEDDNELEDDDELGDESDSGKRTDGTCNAFSPRIRQGKNQKSRERSAPGAHS